MSQITIAERALRDIYKLCCTADSGNGHWENTALQVARISQIALDNIGVEFCEQCGVLLNDDGSCSADCMPEQAKESE